MGGVWGGDGGVWGAGDGTWALGADRPPTPVPPKGLQLSGWWRVATSGAALAFFTVGAWAMVRSSLDGLGVVAAFLASALLMVIIAVGMVPVRAWAKDIGYDLGLGEVEQHVEKLADDKPESVSVPVEAAAPAPFDLTVPLFSDYDRRAELISLSPTAALLAQFGELEEQLMAYAREAGLSDQDIRRQPPRQVVRSLVQRDALSQWHLDIIDELAAARFRAAHAPSELSQTSRAQLERLVERTAEVANDIAQRRILRRSNDASPNL